MLFIMFLIFAIALSTVSLAIAANNLVESGNFVNVNTQPQPGTAESLSIQSNKEIRYVQPGNANISLSIDSAETLNIASKSSYIIVESVSDLPPVNAQNVIVLEPFRAYYLTQSIDVGDATIFMTTNSLLGNGGNISAIIGQVPIGKYLLSGLGSNTLDRITVFNTELVKPWVLTQKGMRNTTIRD